MIRRLAPVLFAFGLLYGCGGGGSGVTPAPASRPAASTQSVVVSITIPSQASKASAATRRPQYVSTNTQSASIAVNGGTPVIANLAAGSPNCTSASGTGRTCTVALSAPTGSDTFTESTFASIDGTGTPLSKNTTAATIVAGQANVVKLTLDGVVASIALALANAAPAVGTAATIPLTVTVLDASSAAIIGSDTFANPITLTDSDTSGATKLSNATLNSPVDAGAVTVAYSGAALASATFGASATGVAATSITGATLTPAVPTTPTAFVDWPSYGFDTERTGFNPTTTGITPASVANFRVAWETQIKSSNQSQPIIATNVAGHAALLIVAAFGNAQAYDASTGKLVWSTALPSQDVQSCGIGAISGTAAYDKALGAIYMVAGNGGAPNHVVLYKLDVATGNKIGQVDTTPTLLAGEGTYSHSGVNFANGQIYFGTGSDCEGNASGNPSWRGRVIEVDPAAMTVTNTFYTTWNQGGAWGGGGVWAWGGVSADSAGNVFVSTGNGEDAPSISPQTSVPAPFTLMPNEYSGYADKLVELNAGMTTVEGANYPGFNFTIGGHDLDYTGVPVVAEASAATGCGEFTATMGKGGELVTNNPSQALGVINAYNLSVPTPAGYFMGNPGYSPLTGLVYAPIPTSGNGSLGYPPGLAAIGSCGSALAWKAQFGPDSASYAEAPRSAPTVTAGGVVFMGTPCTNNNAGGCGAPSGAANGALWAVDASTGTVLNGAKPLLITADNIRMAPSADGLWLFLIDKSGNLYGLTVDPSVKGIVPTSKTRVSNPLRIHDLH